LVYSFIEQKKKAVLILAYFSLLERNHHQYLLCSDLPSEKV